MNKYVVVSFVFMAVAFYELSGGDEFVPRKAELIAAAKAAEAADKAERAARIARQATVPAEPKPSVTQVSLRTPEVPTLVRRKPEPPTPKPEPTTPVASSEEVAETIRTTLISLQQGGDLFGTPVETITLRTQNGLPTLSPDASESPAIPEARDIREVAGTSVNVRDGPGTWFGIVTSLPQGTAVEVVENDGTGWVRLRTMDNQFDGWMAEYLLTAPTG